MKLSFYSILLLSIMFSTQSVLAQSKAGNCEFIKKGVALEIQPCSGGQASGSITCETCPSDACQKLSVSLPANAIILEVLPFIKKPGYRGRWEGCDQFNGECIDAQSNTYYAFLEGYKVTKEGNEQIITWKVINGNNSEKILARLDVKFILN